MQQHGALGQALGARGTYVVFGQRFGHTGPRHSGDQGHINHGQSHPGQDQLAHPGPRASARPARVPEQAFIALHRQPFEPNGKQVNQHVTNDEHRNRKPGHRKARQQTVQPTAQTPSGQGAQRHGDQNRENHGAHRQRERGLDALGNQLGHRFIQVIRKTQIALQHAADPNSVLHRNGPVQPELGADLRDVFVRGAVAGNDCGRVTGGQSQNEKDHQRHDQQHRQHRRQAAQQERKHLESLTQFFLMFHITGIPGVCKMPDTLLRIAVGL